MLRSPAPFVAACPRSASVLKPLPSWPPSLSLPSTPELPAELPGSILQENHGFPPSAFAHNPASACHSTDIARTSTLPWEKGIKDEENVPDLLVLFPEPLAHARSVPDLGRRDSKMRSTRSGNALNSSALVKPSPSTIHHKKSLSETSARRRSKSDLLTSPTASNSKLSACLASAPGNGRDNSSRTRSARKLLHPSPLIPEGHACNENSEKREFRRSVSSVCFHVVVCLCITKQSRNFCLWSFQPQ
jgi:hypothetical protein